MEHQQHGQQCCAIHATARPGLIWSSGGGKRTPLLQAEVRDWPLDHDLGS
jgi:hypothetical protein